MHAIRIAAKSVKLNEGDYRVRYFPEKKKPLEELFEKIMGDSEEKLMTRQLGELAPYARMYKKLMNMGGTQARMPFELVIR